jgi:hypothetical protein
MKLVPVALFTYNRLAHTKETISYLQKNILADQTELFIYSDGGKSDADKGKVKEVRDYLMSVTGFLKVTLIERDHNLGLAQNIIKGVTELVNKYGRVIVLEDDLLTGPYFLQYMNDGLEFYNDREEVISIHGYVYPVKDQLPETFFIKGADCWGWATWKRGWELFEQNGKELLKELQQKDLTHEFDFDGAYYFTKMLEDQIEGKNNSWAIRWNASAFLRNKLTLYPGHSLVQNIGNDNSGTHSGVNNSFDVALYNKAIAVNNTEIKQSEAGHKAFVNYFKETNPFRKKKSMVGRTLNNLFKKKTN